MNERLEDLREQFRHQEALPDEVRRARARFNAIEKVARGHGYPVKEGIGDRRQTPAAILGKLLGDKDKGFSKVLLGSLSAVTHASGSGVMQFAMSTDHPQRSTLEL